MVTEFPVPCPELRCPPPTALTVGCGERQAELVPDPDLPALPLVALVEGGEGGGVELRHQAVAEVALPHGVRAVAAAAAARAEQRARDTRETAHADLHARERRGGGGGG